MYNIGVILFKFIFKNFFKCQIVGVENIPSTKGVIIAANHISLWDPPLIGTFLPRKINFMAKEELFDIPIIGYIIKRLNAFPVKRGTADRVAIKKAISLLKSGECLGLFPEGTRSKDDRLLEFKPGAKIIAEKLTLKVQPIVIVDSAKLVDTKHSVTSAGGELKVIYMEPLDINKKGWLEEAREAMQKRLDEERAK